MRRRAFLPFLEGLQNGDPFAYGLFGFGILLALFVGAIYVIDAMKDEKEKAKKQGKDGPGKLRR